jgi:hypothetical protein
MYYAFENGKANICTFHAASESEVKRLTRDTMKHSGTA